MTEVPSDRKLGIPPMAKQRHLQRAPLVEAVLDVRVIPHREIDSRIDKKLRALVADKYPQVVVQRSFEATLEARPDVPHAETRDLGFHGLMFRSADDRHVAQFQRDGFAFSRLHPYTSWEEILPEAMRLWDVYRTLFQPEEAGRIAVRYINRIRFDKDKFEFSRYLASPPTVPASLPQLMGAFLATVVVHDERQRVSARITQSLEQVADSSGKIAYLLDIDAFKTVDLGLDPSAIRADLEKLREMKNKAFFAYLTEEAMEILT